MKIKALIVLWQRPEITRLCFEGIKRLKKFGLEPICIYSDKENEILVNKFGFEGYYHKNLPLGEKLNFGLKKALETDWEYFTQIGSDDLIDDRLFEVYRPFFEKKEKAFGITSVYFYDMLSGRSSLAESSYPFGCGRMIHRSVFTDYGKRLKVRITQSAAGKDFHIGKGEVMLLNPEAANRFVRYGFAEILGEEEDNRPLWDNELNKTLDFNSEFKLNTKGINVIRIRTDEVLIIDLKSDVNIWKFDTYAEIKKDVLKEIPEKDAIRKTRQIYYNTKLHNRR